MTCAYFAWVPCFHEKKMIGMSLYRIQRMESKPSRIPRRISVQASGSPVGSSTGNSLSGAYSTRESSWRLESGYQVMYFFSFLWSINNFKSVFFNQEKPQNLDKKKFLRCKNLLTRPVTVIGELVVLDFLVLPALVCSCTFRNQLFNEWEGILIIWIHFLMNHCHPKSG